MIIRSPTFLQRGSYALHHGNWSTHIYIGLVVIFSISSLNTKSFLDFTEYTRITCLCLSNDSIRARTGVIPIPPAIHTTVSLVLLAVTKLPCGPSIIIDVPDDTVPSS